VGKTEASAAEGETSLRSGGWKKKGGKESLSYLQESVSGRKRTAPLWRDRRAQKKWAQAKKKRIGKKRGRTGPPSSTNLLIPERGGMHDMPVRVDRGRERSQEREEKTEPAQFREKGKKRAGIHIFSKKGRNFKRVVRKEA